MTVLHKISHRIVAALIQSHTNEQQNSVTYFVGLSIPWIYAPILPPETNNGALFVEVTVAKAGAKYLITNHKSYLFSCKQFMDKVYVHVLSLIHI